MLHSRHFFARRTDLVRLNTLVRRAAHIVRPSAAGVRGVLIRLAAIGALASGITAAQAQQIWREGFEGLETSWQRANSDASYQLTKHERSHRDAHGGSGSEWIRLTARGGTYVHFDHAIGRAAVIDELTASLWLRSDKSGMQLLARVVLPRSRDPETGDPLVVYVRGEQYTRAGRWQKLVLNDIPRKLQREAQMLRTRIKTGVDWREAYVDRIVLNIYGGRGTTNVWIDDLQVAGRVDRQAASITSGPQQSTMTTSQLRNDERPPSDTPAARSVRVRGSLLLIDGRPMFPRMIQHQGEPLAWLKSLGFNTVRLQRPASGTILSEARRQALWLVCPPPVGISQIGPAYDVVLAWDLGANLAADDLDATKRLVEVIRAAERHMTRPIVGAPASDLRAYSRHLDLLDIGRLPLGTSLELTQLARWYQLRPRAARPGSAIWTTVQTQIPPPGNRDGANDPGRAAPAAADGQQIRLIAHLAIASGSRALSFQSLSRLDAPDPPSRLRAASLELLNIELSMLEPWAAASRFVTTSTSSDPEILARVAQDDRSRLLLAIRTQAAEQFVAGTSSGGPSSIIAAGLSHSSQAFRITPVGLPVVRRRRVTGGTLVTFDPLDRIATAVLTQDALVLRSLQSKVRRSTARAARLHRDIAALKLSMVEEVTTRLARQQRLAPQSRQWLQDAREALRQCDRQLTDDAQPSALRRAYELAGDALGSIHRIEREQWQQAVAKIGSPLATPEPLRFDTLPEFWDWYEQLRSASLGSNLLVAGDFENLDQMRQAGWNYRRSELPGVRSEVDLASAAGPDDGLSLRMSAWAVDPKAAPALLGAAPISVDSSAARVVAGQLVRIHGRLMVPGGVNSSVDGLMIVDSHNGEPLAERFGPSTTWREFTMYRRASRSGTMRVSFVLTGFGEAWIDDVTIRPVGRGLPRE